MLPRGFPVKAVRPAFGFSLSRAFRRTHSPRFTSRLGFPSAVAFLTPWQGALALASSFNHFRSKFLQASSLHRFTSRRSVPQEAGFKFPSSLCLLRGSRPFRSQAPSGRLAFPSPYSSKVFPRFRPALRLGVPRGTHNYTLLEKGVNTFLQKFLKKFCRYVVSKISKILFYVYIRAHGR